MAPVSVRKCREILTNAEAVIAIEMYAAAQAMDFRKPLEPGEGTKVAYEKIREHVSFMENDRPLYPDINAIEGLVRDFSILDAVEKEIGPIVIRD